MRGTQTLVDKSMTENEKRQDDKPGTPEEWVQKTSLYREFMAEREEILKHKWIESEKQGHDIGFEKALVDWVSRYRTAWRRHRQQTLEKGGAGRS
jgi:hypothetical protein